MSISLERRSFCLVDPDTALQNVTYARCNNSEQQLELLEKLGELFVSGEFRLLIIDSVMACFRVDYLGRGELSERQQKLGQFLDFLKKIAEGFNVCVFMVRIAIHSILFNTNGLKTNQVQSDPGASALFASADGRKPIGGHVLAHASTTRLLLRKGRGEERVAKVQDSPGIIALHVFEVIISLDIRHARGGSNLHHYQWWHQ